MTSTIKHMVEPSDDRNRLDRTQIDSTGQVQLLSDLPGSKLQQESHTEHPPTSPSSKGGKLKRLFRKSDKITHHITDEPTATAPILADAPDTISDARLIHDPPQIEKHNLKDFAHHPISTAKSKASGQGGHEVAKNLVASEISHGADVQLLKAHDEVDPGSARGDDEEKEEERVKMLLRERQDTFVRWTMDRHVTKVQALPVGTVPVCSRGDFKVVRSDGKAEMDWEGWARYLLRFYAEKYGAQYVGYGSSPPKPSKQTLMPNIERLLIASAPVQVFIMSVRRVYRWEDQSETLKYLGVYLILWGFDVVLPGCLAALMYFIFRRRFSPPKIEDLRGDLIRVESMEQTAMNLSEFIEKRGEEVWVDPLIEDVGPWLMVQLADLANLMETVRNFYEWRKPTQTAITLGILTIGLLAISFTPTRALVRSSSLMFGFVFFGLFPIGCRYPEYRLLASPVKWLLWNIPSHAEWSIISLQAEAKRHQNPTSGPQNPPNAQQEPDIMGFRGAPTTADGTPLVPPPPTTNTPGEDYGSYSCTYTSVPGKLILNSQGVRFVASIANKEYFFLSYHDIQRLEKVLRVASKGLEKVSKQTGEDLRIVGAGGEEHLLKNMKERDQAFTQIVGYSPVRWQVVW